MKRSRFKAQGIGVRETARRLGRDPSTVSRELRRNAATRAGRLDYRASVAQWKADLVARRPTTAKLAANDRLRDCLQERHSGQVSRSNGTVLGPETYDGRGGTSRTAATVGVQANVHHLVRMKVQHSCTSPGPAGMPARLRRRRAMSRASRTSLAR
ncbi:helix-turn-helix domain-containing protein [Streptomyces griseofuscus]|uniref:helix-turn-helix domain-containing protein n=1 Tax=Streptomyces griseofuscus TaxID=146922 RepID=UPI0036923C0D